MRRLHKAFISFLILILAGTLVLECLNRVLLSSKARQWVENAAGQTIGRKVSIGAIRLHPWHGFLLERVSVAEDPSFGNTPFIEADQVSGGLLFLPLLKRREFLIPALHWIRPTVRLIRNSEGRWNFQTLGSQKSAAAPATGQSFRLSIPKLVLSDGRCEIRLQHPAGMPVLRVEGIEADLHLSLPAQIQGTVTADLLTGDEGAIRPAGHVLLEGHYLLQEHRLALQGRSDWRLSNLLPLFTKQVSRRLEQLEGTLSFRWETLGNPRKGLETHGQILAHGLKWKSGWFEGSGDLSGPLQLDPHGARTEGLTLRLSNGTSVELSGSLSHDPSSSFGFRVTSFFPAKEPPPLPPEWIAAAKSLNLSGQISLEVVGTGTFRPKFSLRPVLMAGLQEVSLEPPRGPQTQIHSGRIRWEPGLITVTALSGRTLDQPFRLEGTLAKWDQPEINASFSWGKWDGETHLMFSSEKIDVESLTGRSGRSRLRLFGEINRPGMDANLYGEASFRAEELPALWPPAQGWVKQHSARGEVSTRCLLQGPLLRPADWGLELRAGSPAFQADGIPLQGVSLDLQRKDRRWTLRAGKAGLAGGSLFAAGSLDGKHTPSRWDGRIRLEGVQLDQLARALRWKTQDLSGRLRAEWEGGGESGQLRSVSGSGKIEVAGGQILEIPLLGKVAELLSLPALSAIRFQGAEGLFRVKEGRVETDSLVLRSPQGALTISGWGGFLQGMESPIQWNLLPSFTPDVIGTAIAKGTRYVVGEAHLTGTWKEPKKKFVSPLQNIFRGFL